MRRYRGRVSGPLLDRLDLHVEMPALPYDELGCGPPGETTALVRERVLAAGARQRARQGRANGALDGVGLRALVELAPAARSLLRHAIDKMGFSARAHDRVLRIALTVRDLQRRDDPLPDRGAVERLDEAALAEALSYRFTDRASAWRTESAP